MSTELKICDRGFEIMALCAFRYAINRHYTQCMTRGLGKGDTIENVILDNLDHISNGFKCQMLDGIYNEIHFYDSLDIPEKFGEKVEDGPDGYSYHHESPHYLDNMYNALKADYKNNHDGHEWHKGLQY